MWTKLDIYVFIIDIRNESTLRKPTIMSQVISKLYHLKLYRVHLVMGTDCLKEWKSSYHAITAHDDLLDTLFVEVITQITHGGLPNVR